MTKEIILIEDRVRVLGEEGAEGRISREMAHESICWTLRNQVLFFLYASGQVIRDMRRARQVEQFLALYPDRVLEAYEGLIVRELARWQNSIGVFRARKDVRIQREKSRRKIGGEMKRPAIEEIIQKIPESLRGIVRVEIETMRAEEDADRGILSEA